MAIQEVDASWVRKRLSLLASPEDVRLIALSLRYSHGPDMYLTNWAHFGADAEFSIPGATTSKPEWIRKTWSKEDGGNIVLPRRKGRRLDGSEEPWEVLVQLNIEDMERLCARDQLAGWAERVIDV